MQPPPHTAMPSDPVLPRAGPEDKGCGEEGLKAPRPRPRACVWEGGREGGGGMARHKKRTWQAAASSVVVNRAGRVLAAMTPRAIPPRFALLALWVCGCRGCRGGWVDNPVVALAREAFAVAPRLVALGPRLAPTVPLALVVARVHARAPRCLRLLPVAGTAPVFVPRGDGARLPYFTPCQATERRTHTRPQRCVSAHGPGRRRRDYRGARARTRKQAWRVGLSGGRGPEAYRGLGGFCGRSST